jgi:hypothetical protein
MAAKPGDVIIGIGKGTGNGYENCVLAYLIVYLSICAGDTKIEDEWKIPFTAEGFFEFVRWNVAHQRIPEPYHKVVLAFAAEGSPLVLSRHAFAKAFFRLAGQRRFDVLLGPPTTYAMKRRLIEAAKTLHKPA